VLANFAYLWCLSKGIKSIDRDDLNDWAILEKIEKAKESMPKAVAETWLELNRKGCIPHWAIEQIDLKTVQLAAL